MAGDKSKASYTCKAYDLMKLDWPIMADTVAGTRQMRSKGERYLPKEPAEKDAHYNYRLSRAIFFNGTERTLTGLVGMVFRKEPKLGEDVPELIRGVEGADEQAKVEGQWENIDNAGTHGSVFTKEVFTDAMQDGHAVILVDFPPEMEEGASAADEIAAERRPYWVSYKAEDVINWRTSVVGGKTRLDMIVFKECVYEEDGEYGQKEVTKYRVLRPGSWELYRVDRNPENNRLEPVFEASGTTSLTEIPVAVVYSRKTGMLMSRPPLLDLALINICHYQKYNDFSIYLHIASRPLLWFRARNTAKEVEAIGAYTYFDVGDGGEVAFAETTGAALGAASEDIKDLEGRMATLGLAIVQGKSQPQPETTATEEVLDHVREESDLATAARSLKDGIELCLKFHTQYLTPSATTGGSVELGATIEEMTIPPQELQALSNMTGANQISLETFWSILDRAGKLPADFDPKAERAQLEKDAQAAMDRAMAAVDTPPRGSEK